MPRPTPSTTSFTGYWQFIMPVILLAFPCTLQAQEDFHENARGRTGLYYSFSLGESHVRGEYDETMLSGWGLGMDFGYEIDRQFQVGLRLGVDIYDRLFPQGHVDDPMTEDEQWQRVTFTLFGQYYFWPSSISPYIAFHGGLQTMCWTHMQLYADGSDEELVEGPETYAAVLGGALGMRFKISRRVEGLLDVGADTAPSMGDGWYTRVQIGAKVFY